MKSNLISVKLLVQEGYTITFNQAGAQIQRGGIIGAVAKIFANLFVLCLGREENLVAMVNSTDCIHVWHRRLGHVGCISKMTELSRGIIFKNCTCSDIYIVFQK